MTPLTRPPCAAKKGSRMAAPSHRARVRCADLEGANSAARPPRRAGRPSSEAGTRSTMRPRPPTDTATRPPLPAGRWPRGKTRPRSRPSEELQPGKERFTAQLRSKPPAVESLQGGPDAARRARGGRGRSNDYSRPLNLPCRHSEQTFVGLATPKKRPDRRNFRFRQRLSEAQDSEWPRRQ